MDQMYHPYRGAPMGFDMTGYMLRHTSAQGWGHQPDLFVDFLY